MIVPLDGRKVLVPWHKAIATDAIFLKSRLTVRDFLARQRKVSSDDVGMYRGEVTMDVTTLNSVIGADFGNYEESESGQVDVESSELYAHGSDESILAWDGSENNAYTIKNEYVLDSYNTCTDSYNTYSNTPPLASIPLCASIPSVDICESASMTTLRTISVHNIDDAASPNLSNRIDNGLYVDLHHLPNGERAHVDMIPVCIHDGTVIDSNHVNMLGILPETTIQYNSKAVKVLDDIQVPDYILRTAALGPKFNLDDEYSKNMLTEELMSVAMAMNFGESSCVHSMRERKQVLGDLIANVLGRDREVEGELDMEAKNMRAQIKKDVQLTMEYLKSTPDIIITVADKGNMSIISKKSTLIGLRDSHIGDNIANGTYTIENRSTNWVGNMMRARWLTILGHIRSTIPGLHSELNNAAHNAMAYKYLGCNDSIESRFFTPGRMHGLLKVHKTVTSFRPIVDNSQKLGGNIEGYILKILNCILKSNNVYNIQNSWQLTVALQSKYGERIIIPDDHKMATMDFVSMYTNVPVEKALAVIHQMWPKIWTMPELKETPKISVELAERLIKFYVSDGGYFTVDGTLYKQNKGLMMGASLLL